MITKQMRPLISYITSTLSLLAKFSIVSSPFYAINQRQKYWLSNIAYMYLVNTALYINLNIWKSYVPIGNNSGWFFNILSKISHSFCTCLGKPRHSPIKKHHAALLTPLPSSCKEDMQILSFLGNSLSRMLHLEWPVSANK